MSGLIVSKWLAAYLIAVSLYVIASILAPSAGAGTVCAAQGAFAPSVSPVSQQVFDPVQVVVFAWNASFLHPSGSPVAATLVGETGVKLACDDSACITELPGTLLFSSCTVVDPGVSACGLDPSDPTGNSVLIEMSPGGVVLPDTGAFVELVIVDATATSPPPGESYFVVASTDFANDPLDSDLQASCGADGDAIGSASADLVAPPPVIPALGSWGMAFLLVVFAALGRATAPALTSHSHGAAL